VEISWASCAAITATAAPVPSRRWGTVRHASRRAARSGRTPAAGPVERPPAASAASSLGPVDAFGHERLDELVTSDSPEVDPDAAGGDGLQLDRHVVGEDDEHRALGRLLDDLQQRGRRLLHQVEVGEHQHLAVALVGLRMARRTISRAWSTVM
jgi:hypothetical protein